MAWYKSVDNQLATEIHTADIKCIFGHVCLLFVIYWLYVAHVFLHKFVHFLQKFQSQN